MLRKRIEWRILFVHISYSCTYKPGEDIISLIIVYISSPERYKVIIQFHKWDSPIVSSIGAYNYRLATFFSQMLTPLCGCYSCMDTFTFVNETQNVGMSNDSIIVFYDVEILSTNISLGETLRHAEHVITKQTWHESFQDRP